MLTALSLCRLVPAFLCCSSLVVWARSSRPMLSAPAAASGRRHGARRVPPRMPRLRPAAAPRPAPIIHQVETTRARCKLMLACRRPCSTAPMLQAPTGAPLVPTCAPDRWGPAVKDRPGGAAFKALSAVLPAAFVCSGRGHVGGARAAAGGGERRGRGGRVVARSRRMGCDSALGLLLLALRCGMTVLAPSLQALPRVRLRRRAAGCRRRAARLCSPGCRSRRDTVCPFLCCF